MEYKDYFNGKKITVMGLGLLGRGIGDVRFLAEQGAILTVTDLKTESELKDSLDKLKHLKNIRYVLGKHNLKDFQDCDLVLKSAGVPLDSPFITEAKKNNVPVEMSTALFARFFPGMIVGITGTRGKSTVSAMIFEILKTDGKKTFLGGNVRGVSTLAHLPESTRDEIAVLELDSWQLQGFGEEKLSPHISVFTTFFPDHLNYYQNDLDLYLDDKANIFKFQSEKDFLILGSQCANLIREKYPVIKSTILRADSGDISYNLKVPGEHNRYNAACATKVAQALGIEDATIKSALENFKGIEGRLELIKNLNGVKIYNDTTATTPNATVAALNALGQKGGKNIILIFGGNDKGLSFKELLESLPRFCKAVFVIPGTGSDLLPPDFLGLELKKVENLEEAVSSALKIANPDDTVLFSPAFTSFGQFKNEFDRGEKFNSFIKDL